MLTGQLHRGGTGGWERVEPIEGRSVQRVISSPGGQIILLLASDRTTTGPPAVLSLDNGATWSPFADNLAVGETPYRLTDSPSPEIADSREILVAGTGGERSQLALFRSDPSGTTWTHLTAAPLQSTEHQRVSTSLEVSPRFATDRTVLLVQNSSQGTPSSGACSIDRTEDGGETWSGGQATARVGCYVSSRIGTEGVTWFGETSTPGGTFYSRSTDGGKTWTTLSVGLAGIATLVTSPDFEHDGTLFVGTRGGEIWALGTGLQATDGRVGCATEPVGGFGRIWSTEPNMKGTLGCPRGPEQPFQIRERRDDDMRGLWLEDDRPLWYELSPAGEPRSYRARSKSTADAFWQPGPDRVVDGAVQSLRRDADLPARRGRPARDPLPGQQGQRAHVRGLSASPRASAGEPAARPLLGAARFPCSRSASLQPSRQTSYADPTSRSTRTLAAGANRCSAPAAAAVSASPG